MSIDKIDKIMIKQKILIKNKNLPMQLIIQKLHGYCKVD